MHAFNHGLTFEVNHGSNVMRYPAATMVDYWSRLKPEMDAKGVTKAALSRRLGISYQAIKKVVDGGAFGVENNFKAARLLGLSPEWLSSGKEPKYATAAPSSVQAQEPSAIYPVASRANTLTEHMVALEIALDALPELLQVSGRDVLSKWVRGEIDARKAARDLDELATMAGRAGEAGNALQNGTGP